MGQSMQRFLHRAGMQRPAWHELTRKKRRYLSENRQVSDTALLLTEIVLKQINSFEDCPVNSIDCTHSDMIEDSLA